MALSGLFTGALTWRRLGVLVRQLPAESALHRAVDPDGAAWGLTEHLQAIVADQLANLVWLESNQGRKSPSPRPRRLPRPGVEDDTRTRHGDTRDQDPREVRAYLDRFRPPQEVATDGG